MWNSSWLESHFRTCMSLVPDSSFCSVGLFFCLDFNVPRCLHHSRFAASLDLTQRASAFSLLSCKAVLAFPFPFPFRFHRHIRISLLSSMNNPTETLTGTASTYRWTRGIWHLFAVESPNHEPGPSLHLFRTSKMSFNKSL